MNPRDLDKMRREAIRAGLAEYERRVTDEWSKIAGEPVRVEFIKGVFYGYTSELGALRLFHQYHLLKRAEGTAVAYSANLQTWYFRLETNL